MSHEKTIMDAIQFLLSLINVPRTSYSHDIPPTTDNAPFWIANAPPPSIDILEKNGTVCVGLGNLVRRYMGLEVPGNGEKSKKYWPGGTESWFEYLNENNRLSVINFDKSYPVGTLLIQNFNDIDQGHIAIVIESTDKSLENTRILHNIDDRELFGTYVHRLCEYPNYKRHTHICMPEDWLLKN